MRYKLRHEEWWEERPEMAARVEGQVRALLVAARRRRLVEARSKGLRLGEGAVYRLVRAGVLYGERRGVMKSGQLYQVAHVDPREVAAYAALRVTVGAGAGWLPSGRLPEWAMGGVERAGAVIDG